jgi:hypothetical protein
VKLSDFLHLKYYRSIDINRFERVETELVEKLDRLTGLLGGEKFLILSGYRTPDENLAAGGVANSMHLLGRAFDLYVPMDPGAFVEAAKRVGFKGIGVYVNDQNVVSAHVDVRPTSDLASWGRIGSRGVPYVALSTVLEELQRRGLTVPVAVGGGFLALTILVLLLIFGSGKK